MVNTLTWSIGTFALRPDIQAKAYNAMAEAYGSKTWGPIEDETSVPYLNALVKECLRTFSVLRLSLPRAAWKDIQYGDVFIPKGTTVFLNAWGCNRDETVFGQDADEFRPERFLEDPDLPHAAYGFGTRMCAGFHLANRQLYIMLLRVIWSFKIELSKDPAECRWQMRPLKVRRWTRRFSRSVADVSAGRHRAFPSCRHTANLQGVLRASRPGCPPRPAPSRLRSRSQRNVGFPASSARTASLISFQQPMVSVQ